jgi:hypothetical protein
MRVCWCMSAIIIRAIGALFFPSGRSLVLCGLSSNKLFRREGPGGELWVTSFRSRRGNLRFQRLKLLPSLLVSWFLVAGSRFFKRFDGWMILSLPHVYLLPSSIPYWVCCRENLDSLLYVKQSRCPHLVHK